MAKSRSSTFLFGSLQNFLLKERERMRAMKRGGNHQFVSFDLHLPETEAAMQATAHLMFGNTKNPRSLEGTKAGSGGKATKVPPPIEGAGRPSGGLRQNPSNGQLAKTRRGTERLSSMYAQAEHRVRFGTRLSKINYQINQE